MAKKYKQRNSNKQNNQSQSIINNVNSDEKKNNIDDINNNVVNKEVNDNMNNSNDDDKMCNNKIDKKERICKNNNDESGNPVDICGKTLPSENSNGSFSSTDTFSVINNQESYINDTLNDIPESKIQTVYKLLDEDIVNEEFSLDVHETLENIFNNRKYQPLNIKVKNNDLYSIVHDKQLRKKYFNPVELQICPLVIFF